MKVESGLEIRSVIVYQSWYALFYRPVYTVKSSNFVILFTENIFFLQTLFWLPLIIFRY
jgi:hypothetical protein